MKLRFPPLRLFDQHERLSLLAKLFIAILLIVVFEGALRKWASNSLTYPVIALRDVLALFGILWTLIKGKMRVSAKQFKVLLLLTMALLFWGLIQVLINQTSIVIYLLGLRFWLLYLWFAFMAGITMTAYDFKVISRVLVVLLIAMTPLAVFQHFLPSASFWNKQVDEGAVFTVSGDIVRTTGTFSFTMGYTTFLAMASPFAFLSLDPVSQLWQNKWMPIVVIVALIVATIVSGSRGAIVFFGLLFLMYSLSTVRFVKGRKKKGQALLMILVVVGMLVAAFSIFSSAVEATRDRFELAHKSEKPIDRFIYSMAPQGEIPLLGQGLGMGSNFAGVIEKGQRIFLLAESENARIILEAGILGLGFIVLKIGVLWLAGKKALKIAKYTGSASTMLIWFTVALALLFWPIVGQLTVNAMGYLLFGLGVAALKLYPAMANRYEIIRVN